MSQIDELKVFVSERLRAVAFEILGVNDKTVTDYEQQASRLKEENHRQRSLLDIILESKAPQTEESHVNKSTPAAAAAAAARPGATVSSSNHKAKETSRHSCDLCVFTSRADFLKLTANENCPYCLKRFQATEAHLMRRHYLFAVHFAEGGTEKFVVPCLCKDRINGRSHWHCPYCTKILNRKCNFEKHLFKQHGYAILQQSQDVDINQSPVHVYKEAVPLSPEPWCQQEGGSQEEDLRASRLLQVKKEEEGEISRQDLAEKQETPLEFEHSEQLKTKGKLLQEANSHVVEQSLDVDHGQDSTISIICVDSFIRDIGEMNCVQSSKCQPQPQPLDSQPNCGVGKIWQPAGDSWNSTGGGAVAERGSHSRPEEGRDHTMCSHVNTLKSKKKNNVKRSSPLTGFNVRKLTSARQNLTGPHSCKACGKTFHYMYTLRTHAQTHTADKIHICAICGKLLKSTASLVHHLQCHLKTNKCGVCGKQFSNNSRLKRHRKFHRPKGLNVMSSA